MSRSFEQSIKIKKLTKQILNLLNVCFSQKILNVSLNSIYISDIYLTNDKSIVKLYVDSYDNQIDTKVAIQKLNNLKALFHNHLAQNLTIYKIPKIIFIWDEQRKKQEHLEKIINKSIKLISSYE